MCQNGNRLTDLAKLGVGDPFQRYPTPPLEPPIPPSEPPPPTSEPPPTASEPPPPT